MIVMGAMLQVVLTGIACFALWLLWRAFASNARGDRAFTWIVGAGFLVRAVASQALFWISYLRLPLLRPLQLGEGFWFFAIDGPGYLGYANAVLRHGMASAFAVQTVYPSPTFVKVLALFVAAFGSVASVAILLNLSAYLAACLLLVRIGSAARLPRLLALAAIAFGPGAILWSLQLLKDTLFLLTVVALVAACFAWQETWRRKPDASRVIALAAAILFVIYALAGLRWYFAAIVWGVSALFFFLAALPARQRVRAMLCGAVLFTFVAASVRLGAGSDMSPFINYAGKAIRRDVDIAPVASIPKYFSEVRRGFDSSPGATTIRAAPSRAATTSTTVAPVAAPLPQPAPPRTTSGRMVSGAVAMLVPHALSQWLAMIDVGGGRGLWLFADLDTLVFDLVLLFGFFYCAIALRRKRARVTPLFVLLLLVFVVTAIPLTYSVSNFGTLFRLRQMLYALVALLPLALALRDASEPLRR